jgi:hypothetical protein
MGMGEKIMPRAAAEKHKGTGEIDEMKIGFVDFSKTERDKVLATLRLLGTQTAIDEIGIGVIRDAFSDILFPGISTNQTRAKYLVLIPYIFAEAENQRYERSHDVLRWINDFEDNMVSVLIANSEGETGIIGSELAKRGERVKIHPTSIYWSALITFGIFRNENMRIGDACKIVFEKTRRPKQTPLTGNESYDDPAANLGSFVLFTPILPDYDWKHEASINLTRKEAEFLAERITASPMSGNSLLAYLIKHRINFNSFDEIALHKLVPDLKRDYLLAKSFSDFIFGAQLQYNVLYSGGSDDDMRQHFNKWKQDFKPDAFDINAVFSRIKCDDGTKNFCYDFLDVIKRNDMQALNELIVARERAIKGDRAKIGKPDEYSYSPAHYSKLAYRFPTAKVIIDDILKGLNA